MPRSWPTGSRKNPVSRGPEAALINGVHKYLPDEDLFHREKMANPWRGGTADCWYSGVIDLWVEWKFIELPNRPETIIDLTAGKDPPLSHLQQQWITRRQAEGRNVWVIVGCKQGGVVLRGRQWARAWRTDDFKFEVQPRIKIAQAIVDFCRED